MHFIQIREFGLRNGYPTPWKAKKMLKIARRRSTKCEKTAKIDFRPWPKSKKRRKRCFGHGRRVENNKSSISAVTETEKSLEIAFPTSWKQKTWCLSRIRVVYFIFCNTLIVCLRGTKPCFLRFSSIVPLRKPLSSVFRSSYPYESLFFLFFVHRTPTKRDFSCFSLIVGVRGLVFCVFHQSYPYESLFLLFFVDYTPYLNSFS